MGGQVHIVQAVMEEETAVVDISLKVVRRGYIKYDEAWLFARST